MGKINIAELLRNCQPGMELDCTKYSNVYFVGIDDYKKEPKIKLKIETSGFWCSELTLDKYGKESSHPNAKCLIFPKGKTTWEGFHRPFRDGDILFVKSAFSWILIYKESENKDDLYRYVATPATDHTYIVYDDNSLCCKKDISEIRFATEEERQRLFDALKECGYRWNDETMTLENLPRFKVGDRIKSIYNGFQYDIKELTDTHYILVEVKDKFKYTVSIIEAKNWELVPNFDISILKPFDKVLVRCSSLEKWRIQFFEKYDKTCQHPFICMGYNKYKQCIPYEGNQHLLDTTTNCNNFYRTLEK